MTQALYLAQTWRGYAPRITGAVHIETGLAIFCLLLFSNALIGPLFSGDETAEPNPILRLIWLPAYAITGVFILTRPVVFWQTLLKSWPLLILALLPFISLLWSIDFNTTLRKGVGVIMTVIFAIWLASRYQWADLMRLLALVFVILAPASMIASAAFPEFGVHQSIHPGAWKGLWPQKNATGAIFAIGCLASYCAALMTPHRLERPIWFFMVIFCFFLVFMSTSKTALISALVGLTLPTVLWFVKRGFGFATIGLFFAVIVLSALACVIIIGPGVFLDILGRDSSFTGRTDIWIALNDAISARPWTGYGYSAFWSDKLGPMFWVRENTQWDVPSAHNGWLELALSFGFPGMIYAGMIYACALCLALWRLFQGKQSYWAIPIIVIILVMSFSESIIMIENHILLILTMTTFAKLFARNA